MAEERYVAIGRVLKPHGVRGEVKVAPLTDDPRRFLKLDRVYCRVADRPRQELHVLGARPAGPDTVLLKFREIATPEAADALRQALIEIPRTEAPPLPAGRVYYADMPGLEAVDLGTSEVIGRVTAVISGPQDLLEITTPTGEELLVPWVEAWVSRIELGEGRVYLTPLPGWREP